MKHRENWIDVSKGILILLVVLGHIHFIAKMNGVNYHPLEVLDQYYGVYGCFYMAAFFFLTGMCSNFDTRYKDFIVKNAKSLIIPSITLIPISVVMTKILCGGGNFLPKEALSLGYMIRYISYLWFLVALFFSKQIYYFVRQQNKPRQIVVSLVLFLTGAILGIWGYPNNFFCFKQAFVFMLFLFIGEQYRRYHNSATKNSMQVFLLTMACLFCGIISYSLYSGNNIPSLAKHFSVQYSEIPIYLVLSVSGTFTIIGVAKLLSGWQFLAYIGRYSLIIYGLHFGFLEVFFILFGSSITNTNEGFAFAYLFSCLCAVVSMCLLCANILNLKYLRWLLGKF